MFGQNMIGGGMPVTPDAIERRRKLAEAMMGAGTAPGPVAHPLEGVGRLAQALSGTLQMKRADKAEEEGRQGASDALVSALTGEDKNAYAEAFANPFMTGAQQNILAQQYGRMTAPPDYKTFESGGDIYRYNPADPASTPEVFFDGPEAGPDWQIVQDRSTGEVIAVDRNNPMGGTQLVRQGGLSPEAPKVQTIRNPDGSEQSVIYDEQTGQFVPAPVSQGPGGTTTQKNLPKLTEQQSKDLVYYQRGKAALANLESVETALTGLGDTIAGSVPLVGNNMTSKNYQLANQAGREFLAAILRKDTGAAVTQAEVELYGNMYLPKFGDSPEVIAQKKKARQVALEAIHSGLGSAQRMLDEGGQQGPMAEPVPLPDANTDPLGIR